MARGKVGFWLRIAWGVIYPLDTLLFKLQWRGLEHIPDTGGVLVVSNHVSHADPLTFARYVWDAGRIPRFLAKDELFRIFFVGRVLRGSGQIPVHRGTSDAQASLRDAIVALSDGEAVCIYPEGTVTRDPDMWPMVSRTGIARLAMSTDAPVIPVAQWGPQDAVDVYRKRYRLLPRKKAVCMAGPPVDLTAFRGRPQTAELLREVTDVIMSRVREMVGELRGETPPSRFWRRSADPAASPAGAAPAAAAPAAPPTADVPGVADALSGDAAAAGPPAVDVPATDVPATDVPATDVPATDVPVTDVAVTDVAAAEAGTTTEPAAVAEPAAEASGREAAS